MSSATVKTISNKPHLTVDQVPFRPYDAGIDNYNRDESRIHGQAEGVFFPRNEAEYKRSLRAYEELAAAVTALGGSVAAEHGIGKTKHCYLEIMYNKSFIEEMRAIKKSLDPLMLLGQNNIFTPAPPN